MKILCCRKWGTSLSSWCCCCCCRCTVQYCVVASLSAFFEMCCLYVDDLLVQYSTVLLHPKKLCFVTLCDNPIIYLCNLSLIFLFFLFGGFEFSTVKCAIPLRKVQLARQRTFFENTVDTKDGRI